MIPVYLAVLGCWAPYPAAGGACPGYLLVSKNLSLFLDCGNGSLAWLRRCTDFRELTAVFISHFHPDHYVDLFCLRHALAGARREGSRSLPLPLIAPLAPEKDAETWRSYPDVLEFRGIAPEACRSSLAVPLGELLGNCFQGASGGRVSFLLTDHPLPNLAVRFENEGKTLVYTGDTGFFEALVEFAGGADLLVCEATLQEKDRGLGVSGHLTAREAGLLAASAGVKRLLLTHFWPEHDLRVTYREARAVFAGDLLLAREGLTVFF